MDKNICYMIEGGLGKSVMFTAMIKALREKNGGKPIDVVSAYPDVFMGSDDVRYVWAFEALYSPDFNDSVNEVVGRDPYKSSFYIDGTSHLLLHWAKELGIKYNSKWLPAEIKVKPEALTRANEIKSEIAGKYAIVQFMGGQSPIVYSEEATYEHNIMQLQRNYQFPFANKLVNRIKEQWPDITILDYSMPNEHPGYSNAVRVEAQYITYAELVKGAEFVIGIDSSLLHMAAGVDVPKIGLYGGCPSWQFGWPNIHAMTNFIGNREDFEVDDAWYISIDSKKIVDKLKKIYKK